ncbi:uncharacterized protein JCM15063_005559 [Sporobolomyces koalae]|uniref:uncharacterized protein n=1 Tax=Sporobolomyces koalae TaxID=500713 RepID=UPI00317FF406
MSDSNKTSHVESVSMTPLAEKWTVVGAASPDARSATSSASSDTTSVGQPDDTDTTRKAEACTVPIEGLSGEPEKKSPSEDAQAAPDAADQASAPGPSAESRISNSDSGEEKMDDPQAAKEPRDQPEEIQDSGRAENSPEQAHEAQVLPSLTVTQATLPVPEVPVATIPVATNATKSNQASASALKFNRLVTELTSSFVTDNRTLFASPVFTNHAAPNSAVSPKTASFFSAGTRSPPRPGGGGITELPSDSEPPSESQIVISTEIDKEEDTEKEEVVKDKVSPSSSGGKTMPLISFPSQSEQAAQKRPSDSTRPSNPTGYVSRRDVSTFSRNPSPARVAPPFRNSLARDASRYPSLRYMPTMQHRSRTFVSTSLPENRPTRQSENEPKKSRMSIGDLVDELKKALAQDRSMYYTLKGVLAEHEEHRRQDAAVPAPVRTETRAPKEPVPTQENANSDSYRRRHRAPVKSVTLTQTDTESEFEDHAQRFHRHQRQEKGSRRAQDDVRPRRELRDDHPVLPRPSAHQPVLTRAHGHRPVSSGTKQSPILAHDHKTSRKDNVPNILRPKGLEKPQTTFSYPSNAVRVLKEQLPPKQEQPSQCRVLVSHACAVHSNPPHLADPSPKSKPLVLVNYLRRPVTVPTYGTGRKHVSLARGSSRLRETKKKGSQPSKGTRVKESKGKSRRDNSISFDFDDFY